MQKQFDEQSKTTEKEQGSDGEYAYKSVIKKDLKNRRTISVISLILAVLSIIFIFAPWVGLVCAILSVGMALWSRKNLGYFDKISLAAIIIGIFGVVFSISAIIFGGIISSLF